MRLWIGVAAGAALVGLVSAAQAASCDAIVIDESGAVSDVSRVESAARRLASKGATVRIRIKKDLGGSRNGDALGEKLVQECWMSGSRRLSNLLPIVIAMKGGEWSIHTGSAINAQISETDATRAISTIMVPRWQAYTRQGEKGAITDGLVGMLALFETKLAQPLAGPGSGTTTIVNQQATDFNGLWTAFKWLAAAVITVVVLLVAMALSKGRSQARSLQSEAKRSRSNCLSKLFAATSPAKLGEIDALIVAAGTRLPADDLQELERLRAALVVQGHAAESAFSRFDDPDKEDPNVDGLSDEVYRNNRQSYEDIIAAHIEPAEDTLKKINALLDKAHQSRAA